MYAQSLGGGVQHSPPLRWLTMERMAVPGAQALAAGAEQLCMWWPQANSCYFPVLVFDMQNAQTLNASYTVVIRSLSCFNQ